MAELAGELLEPYFKEYDPTPTEERVERWCRQALGKSPWQTWELWRDFDTRRTIRRVVEVRRAAMGLLDGREVPVSQIPKERCECGATTPWPGGLYGWHYTADGQDAHFWRETGAAGRSNG